MTGDGPRPQWRSPLLRAAAVLVVAVAVALVAAAVGEPADRGGDGIVAVRLPPSVLTLGLDTLIGAFLAAAGLLAIGMLWALASAPRLRRRAWSRERALIVALLMAAGALGFVWLADRGDLIGRLGGLAGQLGGMGRLEGLRAPSGEGPQMGVGVRRVATAAGALAILAGAGAWWWWLRDADGEPERGDGPPNARLAEAVDAALTDIDDEPDPRLAILRCYARLDAALTAAGCPRDPAETPREHRQRAAGTLGPGAEAAARLVDRFERARYDAAPVSEADRRDAVAALLQARAALAEASGAADDSPASQGSAPRAQTMGRRS